MYKSFQVDFSKSTWKVDLTYKLAPSNLSTSVENLHSEDFL